MPRKTFVSGEILTASDVNTYLMDQAVMVFDSAAARDSAISSPSEGMMAYLKDSDIITKRTASAWTNIDTTGKILQVVSTVKLDTFTTTSATFVDVTGLSATITPSSSSSKILVIAHISTGPGPTTPSYFQIAGGNAGTYIGNGSGNRVRVAGAARTGTGSHPLGIPIVYLDSPATTSATTYSIQTRRGGLTSGAAYVNVVQTDDDNGDIPRMASSITVMEVAG